ncbi:MAG: hypothetical protein GF315_05650 [candidate division Zixibacteria bacterium]|nr:hypothetical protein [candidate division Zixibacteria bacterium]
MANSYTIPNMETALYISISIAFVIIIILALVRDSTDSDEPFKVIRNWFVRTFSPILRFFGKTSKELPEKLRERKNRSDVRRRFGGFKYLFDHPDMDGDRKIKLVLKPKKLALRKKFLQRELAEIPLNKITEIRIEKREQARARYTSSGNPFAGVFDDYVTGDAPRGEYFFSIRWEDTRGIKHFSTFRFYKKWRFRKFRSRSIDADDITSIRSAILNAKPPVGHPDYVGPRDVKIKTDSEESEVVTEDIESDSMTDEHDFKSEKHGDQR